MQFAAGFFRIIRHSLVQRHAAGHMTAFHHTVGQARAVLLRPQKPPALLQAVVKLLEVALGKLRKRGVSQLRDDVLIDPVFIVRLGLGLDGRFAVRLIPAVHPYSEGHFSPGALQL